MDGSIVNIGDRVFDLMIGAGVVRNVLGDGRISVRFGHGNADMVYTPEGRIGSFRRLYWENPIFVAPRKNESLAGYVQRYVRQLREDWAKNPDLSGGGVPAEGGVTPDIATAISRAVNNAMASMEGKLQAVQGAVVNALQPQIIELRSTIADDMRPELSQLVQDIAAPAARTIAQQEVAKISKVTLGLDKVDNTRDIAKTVSNPQRDALNLKMDISAANTALDLKADKTWVQTAIAAAIAELDGGGGDTGGGGTDNPPVDDGSDPDPAINGNIQDLFRTPFSADSPWNIQPVSPVFGTYQLPDNTYQPTADPSEFAATFYQADSTDGPKTIYAKPGGHITITDSYQQVQSLTFDHFPADAKPGVSSDGHLVWLDTTTGIIHSFFAGVMDETGRITAEVYTWTRIDGRGWGDGYYYQGVRAVGCPAVAGTIRKWEIDDPEHEFEHALSLTLPGEALASADPGYIFPATMADNGYQFNSGQIPEGALLMLPPEFDVNALRTEDAKRVARAFKKYGGYVTDRNTGTPFTVDVENGVTGWGHNKGWNAPWAADLVDIQHALRMVTSVSGWVNRVGQSVENAAQVGMNLISMRPDWVKSNGDAAAPKFNQRKQRLDWGPAGTEYNLAIAGGYPEIIRPVWARLIEGQTYRVEVESGHGANVSLDLKNSSYGNAYSTGPMLDGETKTFVCPADVIDIQMSSSPGKSTEFSWVRIKLFHVD